MLPDLSRRRASHDKSLSRIHINPTKALKGAFSSNNDANWWMITRSGLTILLLGFLVAWYVIDKKDITLQQLPVARPETALQPTTSDTPNQKGLIPDEWKFFREEMQRFVDELGLEKEVLIALVLNEV